MSFWNRFFGKKKTNTTQETIKLLQLGDIVSLEYKHPKEVGMLTDGSLTYTRLNKIEIENRKIRGTISLIRNKDLPFNMVLIEVSTFESPAMPGQLRKYLFLADEIKTIKKINDQ